MEIWGYGGGGASPWIKFGGKAGLCLEVGIVHPGPRKHWDDKKVIIPIMWDCWLDLFIIPVDPTMGTNFLIFSSFFLF